MKQSILTALLAVHSTSAQDISEDALTGLNLRCVPPSDDSWYTDEEQASDAVTDVQSCFAAGAEAMASNIENSDEDYHECWEAVVTEGGAFVCKEYYISDVSPFAQDDIRVGQSEGAEEGVTYYAWQWAPDAALLEFTGTYPEPEAESEEEDTEEDAGHKFAASAFAAAAAMMISQL